MLWDYKPYPNKYNIQFLLPPDDAPEVVAPQCVSAEDTLLTSEEQQALQDLCCKFLAELGYSSTHSEVSNVDQALVENNDIPLNIQEALDLMHSFAFYATLRDHSMQPLFSFNKLMANVYKLNES